MKPLRLIASFIPLFLTSCSEQPNDTAYGYIETRLLYVSSPLSGKLLELKTHRGQPVLNGQILAKLEQEPQSLEYSQAQASLHQAQANLANLEKGLRPTEIEQIEAELTAAKAKETLAQLTLNRKSDLYSKQFAEEQTVDEAQEALTSARAKIAESKAKLDTAQLPARADEIEAAKAKVEAAEATLQQAEWSLNKKQITAPTAGTTFDTFYEPGEEVPANTPILAILDPKDIYAVFFINQKNLHLAQLGKSIGLKSDGLNMVIPAKISYISPEAEFTPPVIYSQKTREKLVFKVEAHIEPEYADKLHPGQPVDIQF